MPRRPAAASSRSGSSRCGTGTRATASAPPGTRTLGDLAPKGQASRGGKQGESGRIGRVQLDPAIAAQLKRDEHGLVAAIARQYDTGEVLMLAWMDDEALARTLA